MPAATEILNAIVLFANFVFVPGLAYGSQLALGALGVTLVFGILRFANFAHGDLMAFGTMATILVTWWLQSMGVGFGFLPTALLALPFGMLAGVIFFEMEDGKGRSGRDARTHGLERDAPATF